MHRCKLARVLGLWVYDCLCVFLGGKGLSDLPPELKAAPIPLIVIGRGDLIVAANTAAISMGFAEGDAVKRYLFLEEKDFAAVVAAASTTKLWHFTFKDSEKLCHLSTSQAESGTYCWLRDMSEQLAVTERLRLLKGPGDKQLRLINHQSATALGYAELLDVIMDDPGALSPDQLALVRQYQLEVRNSLQRIQQIAVEENATGKPAKRSILLVEGHAALNELITELLKSEGYKVTSFLDASSALQYFRVNHHSVQTAIVGETSSRADSNSLSNALKEMAPALSVITVSTNPDSASGLAIGKPLDLRQLLQVLQD